MDTKLMEEIQRLEEEAGERGGQPIPKGYYLNEVMAKESEIGQTEDRPWFRFRSKITGDGNHKGEGERPQVGRYVSSPTLFWFVGETSERSTKTKEEREALTRRSTLSWLMGLVHQFSGSPDVTPGVVDELVVGIRELKAPNISTTEARALFERIINLVDGEQLVTYVRERPVYNTPDGRKPKVGTAEVKAVYNEFEPFVYTAGKQKPDSEALVQSYAKGMERAGLAGEKVEV